MSDSEALRQVTEDEALSTPDHRKFLSYLVAVEWLDTVVSNAWTDETEVVKGEAESVVSFGCLLEVTKESVKLSAGISEKDGARQHNPTITIPRAMVRRVWSPSRWSERSLKSR